MIKDYNRIIIPYSGHYEKIVISKGGYRFELWGAASGLSNIQIYGSPDKGLGAYVSGDISLYHNYVLYAYVGGKGGNNIGGTGGSAGFNGGCSGANDNINLDCGSGGSGGASDIRLHENDLYSRIIVAGGGGSPGCYKGYGGNGGHGGGISGIDGYPNEGGTIEGGRGGYISENSLFGNGQRGREGNDAGGSGGGGYFAGYGGDSTAEGGGSGGGGGGSSYASGCKSCRTLISEGVLSDSVHPSFLHFNNILMISGNETSIPKLPYSSLNYEPHSEHGLIIITKLWDIYIQTCKPHQRNQFAKLYILIILIYKNCI